MKNKKAPKGVAAFGNSASPRLARRVKNCFFGNKLKITLVCVVGVIALWAAVFCTDCLRVLQEKTPVFCLRDGTAYTGAGYSFEIARHPVTGRAEYALYIFGGYVGGNFTD